MLHERCQIGSPEELLLSEKQRSILIMAARGTTYNVIASTFEITRDGVKAALGRTFDRLHSESILEATLKGIQSKIISPDEIISEIAVDNIINLPPCLMEIFELLGYGSNTAELAQSLHKTPESIRDNIQKLKVYTGLKTRTQIAVASAILFEPESLVD